MCLVNNEKLAYFLFNERKTYIIMSKNKENQAKTEEVEVGTQVDEAQKNADIEGQPQEETSEIDPLKAAEEEIAALKDKYLRSVAEFDNYRKHTMKEKAELILNGGERTIVAMLPVLDDMERAIENNAKSDDITAIKEGFGLIHQKFVKILEGMGVKKIETEGQDFNTDLHNAIAMLPMGEEKKGKVIDCTKAGYTLNDKVIRHADVAVGE